MDKIPFPYQALLLANDYHKRFVSVADSKSSNPLAILDGNDTRFFVSAQELLVVDDTAYIPITGVLFHSSDESCIKGWWTDYSFLHKQIQLAYQNDTIKKVVFNVDSPGGHALGCPHIASEIKELSLVKETMAVVHGLCCSAAYMLSANCNKIYATQGSMIGSIGVVGLLLDDKEYFAKMGLKIYSIGKPHGKTLGRAGQEITPEDLEKQQKTCDEIFEDIVVMVSLRVNREKIMELDADHFTSEGAITHGLIDGILTAEQTLTNTFPKEEIMPEETNPPAGQTPPPSGGQSEQVPTQTLDMQAMFNGIATAVQEGVSQGVALALEKATAASTPPPAQAASLSIPESQPSIKDLPTGNLQVFQTGDQHFQNEPNQQSTEQDNIRNAFNSLASSDTAPKELYVKVQEGNNA